MVPHNRWPMFGYLFAFLIFYRSIYLSSSENVSDVSSAVENSRTSNQEIPSFLYYNTQTDERKFIENEFIKEIQLSNNHSNVKSNASFILKPKNSSRIKKLKTADIYLDADRIRHEDLSTIDPLPDKERSNVGNYPKKPLDDRYDELGENLDAYYGNKLRKFRKFYLKLHGYLSLFVCLFGIVANILNIIVLTRKEMHNSTNFILTGLATSDCIVMISYCIYAYHSFVRSSISDENRYSYPWAVFTLLHSHISIIFHTTSIWLTVILAVWRYIAVSCFGNSHRNWFNMRRAIYVIFFTYLTCICFCIPAYFTFAIKSRDEISYVCPPGCDKPLSPSEQHECLIHIFDSLDQEDATQAPDSNESEELENVEMRQVPISILPEKFSKISKTFESSDHFSNSSNIGNYIDRLKNEFHFSNIFPKKPSEDGRNGTKLDFRMEIFRFCENPLSKNSSIPRTFKVDISDIALRNNGRIKKVNFWVYSVLNKIIPCCLLTYLSLALIRMLYQSNERRHRLRSYGQQQFYSQAANSSFYNPIQNAQLPNELINSQESKTKGKEIEETQFKSLQNTPNSSNQNFQEMKKAPTQPNTLSPLEINRMNESASSNNLTSNGNLSALSPSKSQLEITKKGPSNESLQTNQPIKNGRLTISKSKSQSCQQTADLNSNQSLNQPMNLSSRNNSSASYIYPSSLLNPSSSFNNRACKMNNNTNCDRTTRMLLAILFLFLVTEIPSGILNLLVGILGEVFLNNVYHNLGELMDLLALINNGVNFILYCTMSRQFRKTFQKTFRCNCICFFRPIGPIDKQTTVKSSKVQISSQNQNRCNSVPNERLNLLNRKITENIITKKKETSLNEIDDDDQELVTMNETKQNSSTVEMEDDYLICGDNEETGNHASSTSLVKFRKSSIKQEMILECKEGYADETSIHRENNKNLAKASSSNGHDSIEILDERQANTQIEITTETRRNENDVRKSMNIAALRLHRNSSAGTSSDRLDVRRNPLHRYNDSRKRRRKTIANMDLSDCKNSTSLSTCV